MPSGFQRLEAAWHPDRLLHPWRRALARRRLRGTRPRSVLFLCHGNLCRSPFAAAQFARACADWPQGPPSIHSAGYVGPSQPSPPEALGAAARAGVDLEGHRSSVFSAEDIRSADLVVTMSQAQARGIRSRFGRSASSVIVLGDLDPAMPATRSIRDPWRCPPEVFDESYERITRCVQELAQLLRS